MHIRSREPRDYTFNSILRSANNQNTFSKSRLPREGMEMETNVFLFFERL